MTRVPSGWALRPVAFAYPICRLDQRGFRNSLFLYDLQRSVRSGWPPDRTRLDPIGDRGSPRVPATPIRFGRGPRTIGYDPASQAPTEMARRPRSRNDLLIEQDSAGEQKTKAHTESDPPNRDES